jgi:hypothetical protein
MRQGLHWRDWPANRRLWTTSHMTTEAATPHPAAAVPAPVVGENIDATNGATLASSPIIGLTGKAAKRTAESHERWK